MVWQTVKRGIYLNLQTLALRISSGLLNTVMRVLRGRDRTCLVAVLAKSWESSTSGAEVDRRKHSEPTESACPKKEIRESPGRSKARDRHTSDSFKVWSNKETRYTCESHPGLMQPPGASFMIKSSYCRQASSSQPCACIFISHKRSSPAPLKVNFRAYNTVETWCWDRNKVQWKS